MEDVMDLILPVATTLGLIWLLKLIYRVVIFLWVMFLRPPKDLVKTYGSWAVVTGATDGIGRAMALQLASKGLNLVLVGRNESKLETTAKLLEQTFGDRVEVMCIVIDFDKFTRDEVLTKIREGIEWLDVGVLVNNAGTAYDFPRLVHEAEANMIESVVNVNVRGLTWATVAVLPSMVKKRRGAIVHIGSGSSCILPAYPLGAPYGASKAYVEHFSKSINLEYKSFGIDIQCQTPMLIATKMVRIRKTSLLTPSPETWSKASIRWIGYDGVCMPYWPHYLQSIVLKMIPSSIVNWYVLMSHHRLRSLGMKKEASTAAKTK